MIGCSCRLAGLALFVAAWWLSCVTWAKELPSPPQTWEMSKIYVLEPFAKRGELDQGILRFTWNSLVLVAQGLSPSRVVVGVPLGFASGHVEAVHAGLRSRSFKSCGPSRRSPGCRWAWSCFKIAAGGRLHDRHLLDVADGRQHGRRRARHSAGLSERRARCCRLSRWTMIWKIYLPATLPYMFTGFRLSLGIAWLVIVAAEMLTGMPGVGGFLSQEYNSLIYEHIILCILTIGLVGFVLDRLMSVVEQRLKFA